MTQLNRKLPLGIQDFEEMRRDHYIYADKTDMREFNKQVQNYEMFL